MKSIIAGNLKAKHGATVSCGCFQKEDVSRRSFDKSLGTPEERTIRRVLSQYRCKAKRERRAFGLSFDEFLSIIHGNCAYCGIAPDNTAKFRGQSRDVRNGFTTRYSGIDRLDSSLGYTAENVVPCCKVCNIAKRAMSVDDFSAWVERIAAHKAKTHWESLGSATSASREMKEAA